MLKEPETVSLRFATGFFQCISWGYDEKALDKHSMKGAVVEAWLQGKIALAGIVSAERFEQMKREDIAKQPKPLYVV